MLFAVLFCVFTDHSKSKQAPVVQRLDNTIHWINHYPVDNC